VLLGANFMDTPALRVRFGRVDIQPVFHGPRTLSCLTPPNSAGPVAVAVCNDSSKFGPAAETPFLFVARADPGAPPAMPEAAAAAVPLRPQRVFYDLGRENLAGRAWSTGNDGSELLFGLNTDAESLSGSYDFAANASAENMNILDSN
jgi:hypothetical protein